MAGVGTTPMRCTAMPSAAQPSTMASSSSEPLSRVSRPITMATGRKTRAVARARSRANSVVSSSIATPRTPSVPKYNMF